MSFKKMDPSCTIGFYCRTVQDFEKASEEITKVGVEVAKSIAQPEQHVCSVGVRAEDQHSFTKYQ